MISEFSARRVFKEVRAFKEKPTRLGSLEAFFFQRKKEGKNTHTHTHTHTHKKRGKSKLSGGDKSEAMFAARLFRGVIFFVGDCQCSLFGPLVFLGPKKGCSARSFFFTKNDGKRT